MSLELGAFFEFIYEKSGYDFRNYSLASLERRVNLFKSRHRFASLVELKAAMSDKEGLLGELLDNLTVQVTEMFRDPSFYRGIREHVIDLLRTYPNIKIWHAGCSNGAEVYSMAILLKEANLLGRTRIYATDINETSLKQAYSGIYPLKDMQDYTRNYQNSGGKKSFSDYYRTDNLSAIMDKSLRQNVVFSFHNLATDWIFTEAHFIICRNVLIYFDRNLQNRVLKLFEDSLVRKGLIGLGSKESLRFSEVADHFVPLVAEEKIYQRNF